MRQTKYFEAYLDGMNEVSVYLELSNYGGESKNFYIEDKEHHQIVLTIIDDIIINNKYHKYNCTFEEKIVFGKQYSVFNEHGRACDLIFSQVVKSDAFDQMFYYDKKDLGITYTKKATTFNVWAPTAYKVGVEVVLHGCSQYYEMHRMDKGVYKVKVDKDLKSASYLYCVEVNGQINKCIDPYGKMATVNSNSSYIDDIDSIVVKDYVLEEMNSNCDAIIYEASIRDVSVDGKISGFIKEGKYSFLSYVKKLGITHIQLLPVMDFKSVDDLDIKRYYNWGYDPYQWMCFENSYSTNVYNPLQIVQDMKNLIEACHKKKLRVNLDVVFNHVYDRELSCLEKIVPFYYFQYTGDREFSNSSMCGNDVDSSRLMCRKMIVDTCFYIADKFKIDGLRFDLMGILDVDTMNEVVRVCKSVNPSFMIYGEGWNMPSYLEEEKRAILYNNELMPDIAHFSDRFRDTIKGSTSMNEIGDLGYMLSDTTKLHYAMNVMGGSTQEIGNNRLFMNAEQVINYVECHDNQTSWDKINASMQVSNKEKKAHHKLLLASVILAQGIPFIHCGQEFLRSKNGAANTYNAPDSVNKVDWEQAKKHEDIVNYVRELIRLRKEFSCLRKSKASDIHQNVSYGSIEDNILSYHVGDEVNDLIIYFNPTYTNYPLSLTEGYEMIFYNQRIEPEIKEYIDIHALTLVIIRKKRN